MMGHNLPLKLLFHLKIGEKQQLRERERERVRVCMCVRQRERERGGKETYRQFIREREIYKQFIRESVSE